MRKKKAVKKTVAKSKKKTIRKKTVPKKKATGKKKSIQKIRPNKFTVKRETDLIKHISDGLTIKDACKVSGIHRSTYYEWINDPRCEEFIEKIEIAEILAQATLLKEIKKDKAWQAKAWLLERRWPSKYGRKEFLKVTIETVEFMFKHFDIIIKEVAGNDSERYAIAAEGMRKFALEVKDFVRNATAASSAKRNS